MSREKALRTSKNAAMILAATIAKMAGNFFFVLYVAAQLGLEGFGKYSITVHLFELALSLTCTAVAALITRDIARWPRNFAKTMTAATILVLALCCIAPFFMISMCIGFQFSFDTTWAVAVSCMALFPSALCLLYEAAFVAKERSEFVALASIFDSLARILFGAILLYAGMGLVELIWMTLLVRTALCASYVIVLRRSFDLRWRYSGRELKRLVMRWRVFAGEVTMGTLYVNMDLLVVSWLAGESAAGLYNAAWKFVRLGSVFARSITTSLFPVMSRLYVDSKSGFEHLFRYTLRIMFIAVMPAIVGVMILSDRLVKLLYTEEFFATSPILCVLVWVMLVDVINAFLSRVLFAQTRQRASMYSAAIGLVVNCLFIFYLTHRFSGLGAAYALLISGGCSMVYSLLAATDKKTVLEILREALLVFLAAVLMGAVVHAIRDAWLLLIMVASVLIYVPLLWVLRIVDSEDVEFFQKTLLRKSAVS